MGSFFYLRYCLRNISGGKLIRPILDSFGVLWLFVEIGTFFLGETSPIVIGIREWWYVFLIAGFFVAIKASRPKTTIVGRLNNRDIAIEVTVGDLFTQSGALVIGSNTTFDTHISTELISEKSIQGQFTKRLYCDNEARLDTDIAHALQDKESEILSDKRIGKDKRYPIGTTVKLNTYPKDKTIYMLAIANINEYGSAVGTYEDLKQALACLWVFIGSRGTKGNIAMPVIGTGFSRLQESREEIIREIIQSYIAACSESTFSDKLTIVVSPSDIEQYKINLDELEKYIAHLCKYTNFSKNNARYGQEI
jgi:hypothetical protein